MSVALTVVWAGFSPYWRLTLVAWSVLLNCGLAQTADLPHSAALSQTDPRGTGLAHGQAEKAPQPTIAMLWSRLERAGAVVLTPVELDALKQDLHHLMVKQAAGSSGQSIAADPGEPDAQRAALQPVVEQLEGKAIDLLARRLRVAAYQHFQQNRDAYQRVATQWRRAERTAANLDTASRNPALIAWLNAAHSSVQSGDAFFPEFAVAEKSVRVGVPIATKTVERNPPAIPNQPSVGQPLAGPDVPAAAMPLHSSPAARSEENGVSEPSAISPSDSRTRPALVAEEEAQVPKLAVNTPAIQPTVPKASPATKPAPESATTNTNTRLPREVTSVEKPTAPTQSLSQPKLPATSTSSSTVGVDVFELVSTIDGYNFALGMLESNLAEPGELSLRYLRERVDELEALARRRRLIEIYRKLVPLKEQELPAAAPFELVVDLLESQLETALENLAEQADGEKDGTKQVTAAEASGLKAEPSKIEALRSRVRKLAQR